MSDIVSELAGKSGINVDQAKKGLGAILAFFKKKLPEGAFSQIQSAVPGANALITEAPTAEASSGGILGTVTGLAGKLFGGGDAAALASKLTHIGFTPEQLKEFLPKVLEFLKSKLPADVMSKVTGMIPGS
jgi:hypothetical protein